MPPLVLGSASPRRAKLLGELGAHFTIRASGAPEVRAADESPGEFALRIAREKGAAVAAVSSGEWVLSADTIVVLDGDVLGKPVDASDARAMLRRLSGRVHEVFTAVVLTPPEKGSASDELLVRTSVAFRVLADAEIDAYIATGEPFDKAGAYGIQGAAAPFVARVDGSHSNVVGLPVAEVRALLERRGLLPAGARRGAAGA
jgi:septum formation protein